MKEKPIIYSQDEYNEIFERDIRKEALQIALDTRKFEIELYWKRTTYFWAFIAATYAAYFVLLSSGNINQFKGFTIVVSAIGFFFSLGWYFVNRGSKYWQENWERHVSFLEDGSHGPLFKYVKIPNFDFKKLNGEYPFSVSKVNQMLSLMMVIFWFGTFVFSILFSFDKLLSTWLLVILVILLCIFLLILSFQFKKWSYSFHKDNKYKLTEYDRKKGFFIHT